MKDHPRQPRKLSRLSLFRTLWYRSRSDNRDDAEASRAVTMPTRSGVPPLQQVLRRLLLALFVLALTTFLVYIDRDGYNDNSDGAVDLLDSAYYATVTLSTTGYGDVTPVSDTARFINIVVITPLRVVFLIILVGTTLEVLTERTRQQVRVHRWRSRLRDHVVVVGYGTKGRHAAETLVGQGIAKDRIVIVDAQKKAVMTAAEDGLVAVTGDATRSETLLKAEVPTAAQVIVCPQRDDTTALVTLTARQLNRRATIVVAAREDENVPLLKQSGADTVITSSSSAGRLLGVAMVSPVVANTLEDLMTLGSGLDIVERPITPEEIGAAPRSCEDLIVAVVRGKKLLDYADPGLTTLERGDRVVTVSRATVVEPA
ncbi:potassium channel family protein [Streptomyces acidiscabies]|uniref:Ion channel protein n=1 Tax=Streptomyces acidiscabies TaxID=42234 RepID=A0A0L0K905_9ACTN|nr:potassium channel family protein [Streptomyces acidiscabies]KND34567.1 Ion channel protein [Streptomyces acidiscabies]